MAEQVQRSMMPRHLPIVDGLGLGAGLTACTHLAGDFYNAFRLDRDRVGFYVGDVMGHGPAAALLSVYAMQVIRTKRIDGRNYEILAPGQAFAGLNHDILQANFTGDPFVTMAYGVLDVPLRRLTYSCAGHPPILRVGTDGAIRELSGGGPVIGVVESEFESTEVQLDPGDRLIFYTDGLEAASWEREGRGVEALASRLGRRDGTSLQELVEDALGEARQDIWRADDFTLLAVEVGDAPAASGR